MAIHMRRMGHPQKKEKHGASKNAKQEGKRKSGEEQKDLALKIAA